MGRKLRRLATGLVVPLLLLIGWEAAVRGGLVSAHLLPAPSMLADTLADLVRAGELWQHVLASSLRVLAGFAMGALLRILAGSAVGLSRPLEALFDPTFQALRAIPSLAWVPLLLLWLGIDEAPKVTLVALGAFFPVYLNVQAGLHAVDRKWVEVGEVHGVRGAALLWRIFLPAALPQLFSGLRSRLSLAWMFVVARLAGEVLALLGDPADARLAKVSPSAD